ncbi:MAG: CHAT domain-containing protein [Nannocystaceae bacterium]
MLISLSLALSAINPNYVDCYKSPAMEICLERKKAYERGEFDRVEAFIADEVAIVQRALTGLPVEPGSLRPLCLPIEVGANICERRPERACAQRYLHQYVEVGCLDDPLQRPRYYNNRAREARRHLDDPAALELLRRGEWEAWFAVVQHLSEPSHRDQLLRSIADSMATRAEIAANFRRPDVLAEIVGWIDFSLAGMEDADKLSMVADIRNQLGWSLLLAREADVDAPDPTPMLVDALATYRGPRPDPAKADNIRINLGLAALQRGAAAEASDWVRTVDPEGLSGEELLWLRVVQIRSALAEERYHDVPLLLGEMDEIASSNSSLRERWIASATRGLAKEGLGNAEDALAAYEMAESALESYADAFGAPTAEFADRCNLSLGWPTRRQITLLIDAGASERALSVVRDARTRALRIAARESCREATAVSPRALAPGELRLYYYPLSSQKRGTPSIWAGFAVTADGVRAQRLELELSDQKINQDTRHATALLEPFRAELEAARRIEVLPAGALHDVPFHALPWDGGILIGHAPVLYGLDLATCGDGTAASDDVLILDGRLPAAPDREDGIEDEIATVAAELKVAGRSGRVLQPATDEDVTPVLSGAYSFVHIAAHGTRNEAPELLTSDNRILFERFTLTRDRILEASHAPDFVFLTACLSSSADAESLGGGLSIAQAFLLRGSRYVIGAVDKPSGFVTEELAAAFYRHLGRGGVEDVPEAWRAAYLEVWDPKQSGKEPTLRTMRLLSR